MEEESFSETFAEIIREPAAVIVQNLKSVAMEATENNETEEVKVEKIKDPVIFRRSPRIAERKRKAVVRSKRINNSETDVDVEVPAKKRVRFKIPKISGKTEKPKKSFDKKSAKKTQSIRKKVRRAKKSKGHSGVHRR
jgi:hypothetical protein